MEEAYYQPWLGTWPSGNDWTRAVMGTHVASALQTIASKVFSLAPQDKDEYLSEKENLISRYFTHLIGFYFGQNDISLRGQAYDDMLWVVLGWLDAIQLIDMHPDAVAGDELWNNTWYGRLWTAPFAHRSRIFWELASAGWDDVLCGGGMTWNPKLLVYKNAITNELWIAASIHMYFNFPGDTNTEPFLSSYDQPDQDFIGANPPADYEWRPRDPRFLDAAVKGYAWLTGVNMTNDQGLYVDGFHISNLGNGGTTCDRRDEQVYTYNQGVILSAQLGLFRATGAASYLDDGHRLIQSVLRATGWDLASDSPLDRFDDSRDIPRWHGLGRAGVLEDKCDLFGTCSQNAHTFKGIWMIHFTAFCAPLPHRPDDDNDADDAGDDRSARHAHLRREHDRACARYVPWLRHNAAAALGTRNAEGKFGTWWTIGLLHNATTAGLVISPDAMPPPQANATDYRNFGVPDSAVWKSQRPSKAPSEEEDSLKDSSSNNNNKAATPAAAADDEFDDVYPVADWRQRPITRRINDLEQLIGEAMAPSSVSKDDDPNDRGRGRTVETQGGAMALLRALWEITKPR